MMLSQLRCHAVSYRLQTMILVAERFRLNKMVSLFTVGFFPRSAKIVQSTQLRTDAVSWMLFA